ncbi:MAG: hypothetical protein MPW14_20340 [Candidatus Manganitrophus sp.]|nr:MAG: hypothetical protein MPW14_20340 [Candidatus Manganitrophus sp.]
MHSGSEVTTRAYFDDNGGIDPDPHRGKGLFLAFGLTPGVYTVIATDPVTEETIERKSLPVYPNGVHLVELVQAPGEIVLGGIRDPDGNPITPSLQFSLIGEDSRLCPRHWEKGVLSRPPANTSFEWSNGPAAEIIPSRSPGPSALWDCRPSASLRMGP